MYTFLYPKDFRFDGGSAQCGHAGRQAHAAAKAREYLDKPAVHETMVKVRNSRFNMRRKPRSHLW